jgi:hypothetical protein
MFDTNLAVEAFIDSLDLTFGRPYVLCSSQGRQRERRFNQALIGL